MNNLYRLHPQPAFNFNGLVIDNFAGGGACHGGTKKHRKGGKRG